MVSISAVCAPTVLIATSCDSDQVSADRVKSLLSIGKRDTMIHTVECFRVLGTSTMGTGDRWSTEARDDRRCEEGGGRSMVEPVWDAGVAVVDA